MLVTDDDEIHQMALCLRAHGWTRDIPGSISRGPFDSPYRFIRPGYNLRPTEVAAAVGLVQLRRQEAFNAVRRMNAEAFHREFSGDRFSLQDRNPRGHWTPFGFPIVFRNPTERDAAARAIQGEWIECRLITGGSFFLHESAMFYEGARSSPGGTPFADRAHGAGLFVGNPPFPLGQDRLRALRRAIDAAVPR